MTFLIIAIVILVTFFVFRYFRQRTYLKELSEEQFKKGYRKAQLIDVREPQEFDRGHILGARNIQLTQMRQRLIELRRDKPVYLYGQGIYRDKHAAHSLHTNIYQDLSLYKVTF